MKRNYRLHRACRGGKRTNRIGSDGRSRNGFGTIPSGRIRARCAGDAAASGERQCACAAMAMDFFAVLNKKQAHGSAISQTTARAYFTAIATDAKGAATF